MKRVLAVTGSIVLVSLFLSLHLYPVHPDSSSGEETGTVTRVVMLGTGTPNAEPDRSGPALAVVVGGTPYLIDAGPGVVRRAVGAFQAGIKAMRASNINHLFITHLHSDHTLGYPDLIFTPWVLERNHPLNVFGPRGTGRMTRHLIKAYRRDIRIRLNGAEPANRQGYRVNVQRIREGLIFRDRNVKVYAFPVQHGAWKQAFGFRFETPDRNIVISGDRAPGTANILKYFRDCDILVHEVYSAEGFRSRPEVWQNYHKTAHTSSLELAELAREIKPKLLVLYHQLLWGSTPDRLLAEIRGIYKGRVVYANDLDVF